MTTTSASQGWAADASIAIAALDSQHTFHAVVRDAVLEHSPVLSGHAAFESFSVLTRLPGALRVSATDAQSALHSMFGTSCWLTEFAQQSLLERLRTLGVVGGSVYDALVGEASRVHNRCLLTNDRRASRTYELIGVKFELVGS